MAKKWPESGTLYCENLLRPVKELAQHMIKWENIGHGKDLRKFYQGYDFGERVKATGPEPDDLLTVAGQEHERDQGRDDLDTLFLFAFCLGVEQGTRLRDEEVGEDLDILLTLLTSEHSKLGKIIRGKLKEIAQKEKKSKKV